MSVRHRVAKLERALRPPPTPRTKRVEVYTAPAPEAPADEHTAFRTLVQQALKVCDKVVVVASGRHDYTARFGQSPKLEVVQERWQAAAQVFAARPSTEGRRSQLEDILAGLSGNVIEPGFTPTFPDLDDEDEDDEF